MRRITRATRWAVGLWWHCSDVRARDIPDLARLAYKRGLRDD